MNELKLLWAVVSLLVLVPFFILLCYAVNGPHWFLTVPLFLVAGYYLDRNQRRAKAAQKAAREEAYRLACLQQEEYERQKIQRAVQDALTADRLKDTKKQWN